MCNYHSCNRKELDTTDISMKKRMGKYTVVYSFSGTIHRSCFCSAQQSEEFQKHTIKRRRAQKNT